ncbi:MAG: hypothetical protein JWM00_123 [Candidatus Saccharibacteria bacterium]|nr:hypothetical protein [Candidatus Saccharibacteria bacterium]
MKNIIKKSLQGLLLVPILALGVSLATPAVQSASAAACADPTDLSATCGAGSAQGNEQQADLFGANGIFKTVTNVLLFIIGAISVIMLIIGGIRYTVSGGDSAAVTSAKNTILYAIVGIIVALLAYAVVNFVLGSFTGTAAP